MSIAFLYPLAWLGALAVAAPIWLHLRRRADTNLVRFSAMRFLEDQPRARARPLWPRNWPLLLLRLLALLLLIAAFSWPYLPTHEEVIVRESRVYILDNTLSHQASGGFEKARDEILDEVDGLGIDTQVAVVELTAQPRLLVSFGDSREEATTKLRDLKPSYQRGSYLAAFRTADRLLRQSLGHDRRIVLLGDSQENQWNENRHVPPFLENVEVTLPGVAAPSVPNLGLAEPIVQRLFSGDRAVIECTVRLCHQGDVDEATVVFGANGEDVFQREIQLDGQPESLTLFAQWEADPGQWVRGEIRLEGEPDALSGDDRVVFSLPPVREGRVGLLSQSPFLQTALSPEVMQGRWTTYVPDASNPAGDLEKPSDDDVLCVESQYLETAFARELVLDFLNQGQGVVLVVDRVSAVVSGFLRKLGIETIPEPREAAATSGIRYVFMEHEIFRPFRAADFGNLTEITTERYRRLRMPGALPLVFSDAGDPLLFESEQTKGRLLVFAFSLDRTETNWPLHPTFVPFLDRCLCRVRSAATMETDFQPGETCVWTIPAGRDITEVVLRKSDGTGDGETVRASAENGQSRFRVPDLPGLYALSYDDDSRIENLLAVNPPPKESFLNYVDSAEVVETWKRDTAEDQPVSKSAGPALELSKPEILRQHIWWWLLLGGLTLLIVETAWLSIRKATT